MDDVVTLEKVLEVPVINRALLHIVGDGSLVQECLSYLRDSSTASPEFCEELNRISTWMALVVGNSLPTEAKEVLTPTMSIVTTQRVNATIGICWIMRAAEGMASAFFKVLSRHIKERLPLTISRNEETLQPSILTSLPFAVHSHTVILLDVMLATGGSAIAAIDALKKHINIRRIIFVGIIGAPEGVEALQNAHPDVEIWLAAIDKRLNEKGYIIPGLGDAGNRYCGTY